MTYRTVLANHPITLGNLPAKVRKDLELACPAQFTVLATEGPRNRLVGFFRYEFDQCGTLRAAGTWVAREARGKGLAAGLWIHVLKRARPRRVWVKTVSVGGRALATALARRFPSIRWTIV